MDILVLGGTSFVGRGIVECLLGRGHRPALFNRGRTGADLFPGSERLVGDRDSGDYTALAGRGWDAVVDVTGYVPRHVSEAIAALGDRVGRYVFMSTGLVYDRSAASGKITEASPRLPAWRESEVIDDDNLRTVRDGGTLALFVQDFDDDVRAAAEQRGVRLARIKVVPNPRALAAITNLMAAGTLVSHVSATFPLDEAPEAHRHLDTGVQGKVVLVP